MDLPEAGIDANSVCATCANEAEPWICLSCYKVGPSSEITANVRPEKFLTEVVVLVNLMRNRF